MCPTVSPNAPECLRQREQWQWIARVNGQRHLELTPPQRQLPPTVSAMAASLRRLRGAASADSTACPRRARRSGRDRFLGDPLPQVACLAGDGRVLSAASGRCRFSGRSSSGRTGDSAPRPRALRRAAWIGGAFFAADLDPLALLDREGRRRPRHGARQHAGRPRRPARVGALSRAAVTELAARDPGRDGRNRPHLGRAGETAPTEATRSSARSSGSLTGVAYSGFLLALRRGSGERGRVAGPLFDATLASAVFVVPIGLVLGDLDFTPSLEATGLAV